MVADRFKYDLYRSSSTEIAVTCPDMFQSFAQRRSCMHDCTVRWLHLSQCDAVYMGLD